MPADELTFRTATLADTDELVALVESAYRGDASREGWTTEADLLEGQRTDRDALAAVITSAAGRLVVAEDGTGAAVACCQLESRPGDVAYFGMFAVRPGLQGRGIGRALIEEAERLARDELDATTMRMTVIRQRGDLIAWYERLGYARTGQREPFPYGDDRFGRPTRPDLEFEVLTRRLPARSRIGAGQ
ncbi:GNAT family N-acetyltransferase [Acidiferrimicrobium sp. IK]|uniref:GNAT family N-acetyltransferase n=1 Tax=Acidiferrimicrobium sp. IK TaxID=2871700 RepID=UPI0021CB1FD4|nr:N-acetyltransferase [Acidiferrimicrobium sp. IK]MCU4186999.1 GNAT family N-acetyltransferase [Acidiferrimicrobium sp. IK]